MEPEGDADTTFMKSKVSPRLLIPLGIAVVLLIGFGALRVLGGDDASTPAEATQLPGGSDAAGAETASAPAEGSEEAVPGPGLDDPGIDGTPVVADETETAADWAAEASKICAQATQDLLALADTATPIEATEVTSEALEIARDAVEDLKAVPPNPGQEAEVAEYLELLDSSLDTADALVATAGSIDPNKLSSLIQEQVEMTVRIEELGAILGVGGCIDGTSGDAGSGASSTDQNGPASQALEAEVGAKGLRSILESLEQNESVVVVVYSPKAELDSKVLRETRAAADETGAGFVVIDGTKEREIRLVAEAFNLRETPATLVVNEGLVVSTKLVGFADRETVTQAVTNAHLAS